MSEIRASDDERERTVEALRRHAATGRISADELEERLGLALAATTQGELARIVGDLPAERPSQRPAPVHRHHRHHRRHACGTHGKSPQSMLAIAVLLVAIWAVTGAGYFWPMWPLAWFAFAAIIQMRGNPGVIRYHNVNRYHTSHR